MAAILARVKGMFLMPLTDHKDIRRIFKAFRNQTVSLKYSCMGAKTGARARSRGELLVSNYYAWG